MLRGILTRLLGGLAVIVLTIYGFRAAPTTVGIVNDQIRLMMPWLKEAWISLACIAAASSIATLMIAQPLFARAYTRHRLRIVFPNAANLDSKQSLFRQSTTLYSREPTAQGARRIGTHKIFVGVENVGSGLTARNARLCAVALHPPGYAIDISFPPARNRGNVAIDIQPGDIELFLVLVGNDEGRFTSTPRIVEPAHFEQACALLDQTHERAYLARAKNGSLKLLRNDSYVLELRAYADDSRPAEALALINTRERIELFVYESRFWMRVARLAGQAVEKGQALKCHVLRLTRTFAARCPGSPPSRR